MILDVHGIHVSRHHLSSPLFGGRLERLASVHLKHTWLILLALGVQILITDVIPTAPHTLNVALHLASYVAAAIALWANRALPGLVLIGIGAMLNGAIIAINGGTLPASSQAHASAGLSTNSTAFANSGVVHHPLLSWFGDILATPAWLPFRNVISIGDLIILVGTAVLVHSGPPPPRTSPTPTHYDLQRSLGIRDWLPATGEGRVSERDRHHHEAAGPLLRPIVAPGARLVFRHQLVHQSGTDRNCRL